MPQELKWRPSVCPRCQWASAHPYLCLNSASQDREHTHLTREGLADQVQALQGTAPIALPSSLATWHWAPEWHWVSDPYDHKMKTSPFCFLEPH